MDFSSLSLFLGWHVRFFGGPGVSSGSRLITSKKKKKEKNADPLFNRLYLKQMNYKARAYIFKRTHMEASVELVNHWITRENINRISRQTCTHALRRACQKGGSLMEQDIRKEPRKTVRQPGGHSCVIQWFWLFMTRKKLQKIRSS